MKTYGDGWFDAMHRIHNAFSKNPEMSAFELSQIAFQERKKGDEKESKPQ